MAAKNNTEVIIDGKVYTLSGYESQEYLQKVATYIQIRMESDAKSLKDLEKENKELLLNKTRLEATLEDALLGKVDKLEKPEKTEKPEEKKAVHTEEKKEEKPSGKKA